MIKEDGTVASSQSQCAILLEEQLPIVEVREAASRGTSSGKLNFFLESRIQLARLISPPDHTHIYTIIFRD